MRCCCCCCGHVVLLIVGSTIHIGIDTIHSLVRSLSSTHVIDTRITLTFDCAIEITRICIYPSVLQKRVSSLLFRCVCMKIALKCICMTNVFEKATTTTRAERLQCENELYGKIKLQKSTASSPLARLKSRKFG